MKKNYVNGLVPLSVLTLIKDILHSQTVFSLCYKFPRLSGRLDNIGDDR